MLKPLLTGYIITNMGRKKQVKVPLTRDEIMLKYYYSKPLHEKFEKALLRCGINKDSQFLDDCIQETFKEIGNIPP